MIFRQCGISLIEVLISIVLLSVAILGLFKLQAYMDVQSEYAYKSLQALQATESKLEHFRTRSVSGAHNTVAYASITDGSEPVNANGITVDWTVTSPSGGLSSAVKTIVVNGKWNDRLGYEQKVTLKTMISKYSEFD